MAENKEIKQSPFKSYVVQDFTLDKSYTRSEKIELNDSKLAQLIKQKYIK
jgi:hypothetical protein